MSRSSAGQTDDVLARVSRALGRSAVPTQAPVPPQIDLNIARLVRPDADALDLFIQNCAEAKFKVKKLPASDLAASLLELMKSRECKRIGLNDSPLLQRLNVFETLKSASLDVRWWHDLTLDQAYDLDCGITDVWAAVAETASLVIRPQPENGRALSLVPPTHVAILEKANIVPDIFDVFDKLLTIDGPRNITFITGPSKTADIEGYLVTGVHGPGLVQVYIIE